MSTLRSLLIAVLLGSIAAPLAGYLPVKASGTPKPLKMLVVSNITPGEPVQIPDGYRIVSALACGKDATGFSFGEGRALCLIAQPE